MDISRGTESLSLEEQVAQDREEEGQEYEGEVGVQSGSLHCDTQEDNGRAGSASASSAVHENEEPTPEASSSPRLPASRASTPPVPSQQPSLADGIIGTGQEASVSSRPATAEGSGLSPHLSTVYARPATSAPPSHFIYGSHSGPRRHANGLPLRQTTGPLPGMSYLCELASRYPIRQAPANAPEVSLVSGQLYVGGRLARAISPRLSNEHSNGPPPWATGTPQPVAATGGAYTAHGTHGSYLGSSFLHQRRLEKEKRAKMAAQHPRQGPRDEALRAWAAGNGGPGGEGAAGSGAARRTPSARERALRESVERWLEAHGEPERDREAGLPRSDSLSSSKDPSQVYRQYGIFRTYGAQEQGHGLRPSSSLPVLPRGRRAGAGLGVGYGYGLDPKKRISAEGSPSRPPSQPLGRPRTRQTAW